MPKLKTKKSAAKRFKVTANGEIKREKAYAGHFLTNKKMDQKRNLRSAGFVSDEDKRKIRKLIPYK
ncbi:MAG: 50S ribosomal protein L35 [bacterium]|nr:50S ribosomal protein L35 [bacterium]